MNLPHIVLPDNMKASCDFPKDAAMVCYACKTTLIPQQDRPNLIFLKDEEVEPMELKECPKCGNEFQIYDKEAGMTITQRPQVRA